MNKNIKTLGKAALAMMAGVATLTACEDEPDKYEIAGGSPELLYVCKSTNPDSLFTSAFMGERVVLVGNNLRSITKLYFNDQPAILNTSLMTDHTVIVSVPTTLTDNPTDLMYMVNNNNDTTTFPFMVDVPAPVLANMWCESVKPGQAATINGDFLLSYDNSPMVITMPDGQKVTEFESLNKTSVTFIVPEGCTKSGAVTVQTKYGTTKSSKFEFNDNRGLLFEFDGVTGLGNHGWHAMPIEADETSLDGNFLRLGDGSAAMSADGGWNDAAFSFEYWCGPNYESGSDIALNNLVDFSNYDKMALKFEMLIPTSAPWKAGAMQIIPANRSEVSMDNPNNTHFNRGEKTLPRALYRPWEATGSFDTGDQWMTVTIPFSDFIYNYDASTASEPLTADSFESMTIFVWSGGVNGTDCTPIIKLDNIRAVPYK